jgi:hypothetical protein
LSEQPTALLVLLAKQTARLLLGLLLILLTEQPRPSALSVRSKEPGTGSRSSESGALLRLTESGGSRRLSRLTEETGTSSSSEPGRGRLSGTKQTRRLLLSGLTEHASGRRTGTESVGTRRRSGLSVLLVILQTEFLRVIHPSKVSLCSME